MTETLLNGVLLLAVVGLVSGLARKLGVLRPILLLVVGIGFSYVPGFLDIHLDPAFILQVILPLLIYSATLESSLPALRRNLRPVLWLAVGHVLFITVIVGLVVHAAVPSIPLPAAFALGAIVSPPDAVSATAIGRRIGLPRRTVTILEGEGLLNDATALVVLRVAVAAATGAALTWWEIGGELLFASIGGALIGLVAGVVASWLHRRTDDPLLDNTISILTPFVAFLPAEHFGTSGIVAVVVCGLYVAHRRPGLMAAASRLQMDAFWNVMQFLLEGVVFLLVGLQIRFIVNDLTEPLRTIAIATFAVLGVILIGRLVWIAIGYGIPFVLGKVGIPGFKTVTSGREMAVVFWAGMRGVITLAAAMGLPHDFPQRNLIVWLAFEVILVTLLVQGFTLPWFARLVKLSGDDHRKDLLAEAEIRQAAYRASIERLSALAERDESGGSGGSGGSGESSGSSGSSGSGGSNPQVVKRLETLAESRAHHAWERLGNPATEPPSETFRRLRKEMIDAERSVFVDARNSGKIPDDVLRQVQKELDLEEMMLSRERDVEETT